jgi:hypothetical protein
MVRIDLIISFFDTSTSLGPILSFARAILARMSRI